MTPAEVTALKSDISEHTKELAAERAYLAKLRQRLSEDRRPTEDRSRAALALRIVRQAGRVAARELRLWYLEQVLLAHQAGVTSLVEGEMATRIANDHRLRRAAAFGAVRSAIAEMDGEIRDPVVRQSFEKLRLRFEKEFSDVE